MHFIHLVPSLQDQIEESATTAITPDVDAGSVNLPGIENNSCKTTCKECHLFGSENDEELWILIGAILDRLYFCIYVVLFVILLVSAIGMALKVQ